MNSMIPHSPSPDEQVIPVTSIGEETKVVEEASGAAASTPQAPVVLPKPVEPEEDTWYFEEEEADAATPLVAPFQRSSTLPPVARPSSSSAQQTPGPVSFTPARQAIRLPRLSLLMLALPLCGVVLVGFLVMSVLAQTQPPLSMPIKSSTSSTPQAGQQHGMMPSAPTSVTQPGMNGQAHGQAVPSASAWMPRSLPNGWTQAGLSMGDAIEALRTAVAFTDREMSLDYRSAGTRAHHSGTFTAATFILTPAAQQRFIQNDVREINNTLFDRVQQAQLLRMVVSPQPNLVAFEQQGQQQFAWVAVSFQLWQSQLDPNAAGQRVEGLELDPATQQPRIHQMMVLLLRVPAGQAGSNPAMGGTGWLVSTYGLDLPRGTSLSIIQPA